MGDGARGLTSERRRQKGCYFIILQPETRVSFSVIVAIVGEKDSSKHLTYAQQSNFPVCLCEMKLGKSQSSLN